MSGPVHETEEAESEEVPTDDDSWEPPDPSLGGPGQLLVAVVFACLAGVGLLALAAALSWLLRLR